MLEYSKNYSKTTGSFWNYYRDELNSGLGGANNNIIKWYYKEIIVPLKYLSNFWRTLDTPLINSEINLPLTWSDNCVLTSKAKRDADPAINNPTNATFKITDTKLYVSIVSLSTENDKTLLEQLGAGFKRTIKWNKYRLEMTNHTQKNNLNYLIDITFAKVNRLFALSFENEDDRITFSNY